MDDPVRRDREGWQAGINAAIERLRDDITDQESEANRSDITAHELSFIRQRIAQTNVHIWQIRELNYPDGGA